MSNEIATYSMILSKLSLGQSGTECPTKTQILAINSLIVIDNASTYGANECVKIDDIRKKVETWNYYLTVSPTSMSFGAGGGSKTFTVSSYKRKVLDGVEQSGDTSVSLKSTTISGTGFSLSGTTVSASANEGTSNRTGTVTITQNESNKTATISLSQSGATPSTTYTFSVNPYKVSVDSSGGSGSVTITSYKTVGSSTYDVDYSIDSSTLPSWASFNKSTSTFTIQSTTSTTGRTAKVYFDQDESGKRDYAELTQTGYTPPADNYVFTWEDGSTSDASASFPWNFSANGTAANIPVISTKNGSSQSWSVSSKPSWITTSTTSSKVTISASDNSGSARSGEVVLTQSGSGKTLTVNVSQDAYVADTYVFTITPNTYDAPYSNTTFIPRTVSTKNGSNIGYSLTSGGTDWVVVSTTGKITVEILKNTTSSTRSTTLVFTQNESGKTQSIEITQSGYISYTFNVSPTNLSVTAAETNETLTVNSYKTVLKSDGSETTESLDYEFSSNNSWVAAARTTTNTTYITVAENETTTQRTAKITLTQADSGAQAFVNVIQDGKAEEVVNKLTLNSLTYDSGYLFLPGTIPVESNVWNYFMFVACSTFNWYASLGMTVNGGTAYAGNIVDIYVYSSGSYKLVKSFQLQLGEQTVNF